MCLLHRCQNMTVFMKINCVFLECYDSFCCVLFPLLACIIDYIFQQCLFIVSQLFVTTSLLTRTYQEMTAKGSYLLPCSIAHTTLSL